MSGLINFLFSSVPVLIPLVVILHFKIDQSWGLSHLSLKMEQKIHNYFLIPSVSSLGLYTSSGHSYFIHKMSVAFCHPLFFNLSAPSSLYRNKGHNMVKLSPFLSFSSSLQVNLHSPYIFFVLLNHSKVDHPSH